MIGKTIKQLRKKTGLNQIEFAKRVGVGLRFLRELEQGKSTVQLNRINQVLEFLGYHIEIIKNDTEYYNKQDNKFKYSSSFDKRLKLKIRKRDNYQCQLCGISQGEYKKLYKKHLSIHHIDYNKQNSNEKNLISLCQRCHARIRGNKIFWTEILKKIVIRKYFK